MAEARDPNKIVEALPRWLSGHTERTRTGGFVFGLIDSAVVCGLAARAVGRDRCAEVDREIRRRWYGGAHKRATPPIATP